jgi:hypothetical protein
LKNKTALRDRLRALLAQAKDVKDILSVEEQLTRLQTEIDAMESWLKSIRSRVAHVRIGRHPRAPPDTRARPDMFCRAAGGSSRSFSSSGSAAASGACLFRAGRG